MSEVRLRCIVTMFIAAALLAVPAGAQQWARLPPTATRQPLTVIFSHTTNWAQGRARVTSSPPGIDCPSICSANFDSGFNVGFTATADSSSVVRDVSCWAKSGSTEPEHPGNSKGCVYPGMFAARGGIIKVTVDIVGSGSGAPITGSGLPPTLTPPRPTSTYTPESGGAIRPNGCDCADDGAPTAGAPIVPLSAGLCHQDGRNVCANPLLSTCVVGFYDKSSYGWYAFQNNCGQAINLLFVPLLGSAGGGQMNLAAGQHDSTAWGASEIASFGGGYSLYVCPLHYSPVTAEDRVPSRPGQQFTCRPSSF